MTPLMVPCPRCNGLGTETYQSPSGVDEDLSYDTIECKMCDGKGQVLGTWAAEWETTGVNSRCEICSSRRPCAIIFTRYSTYIICAPCEERRQEGAVR